jgi:hypothetical protein
VCVSRKIDASKSLSISPEPYQRCSRGTGKLLAIGLVGLRAGSRLLGGSRGQTPNDTQVSAALMRIISRPTSFPNSLLTLSVSGNTCTIECVGLPSNLIAHDQLADCAMGFAASG